MVEWNDVNWGTIFFTDEKKVNLDDRDGIECYWNYQWKEPDLFYSRTQGGTKY